MLLSHRPGNCIAIRGQKHVTSVMSENSIPPFVILDRKNLNQDLTVREIPGTMYGLSAGLDGY